MSNRQDQHIVFAHKIVLIDLHVQIEAEVFHDGHIENPRAFFIKGIPIENPKTWKPIPWGNLLGLYAAEHNLSYDEAEPAIAALLYVGVRPYATMLWGNES